mgnify:CR=1 FL=1
MNRILTTLAAVMLTTPVVAGDSTTNLPGLSLNTDVVATYLVDAGTTGITINPEVTYKGSIPGLLLTLGTTLDVWDDTNHLTIDNEFNHLPVAEVGVSYFVMTALEVEAFTNYDFSTESRNDVTLRATYSF